MAKLITLQTIKDHSGKLTVFEKLLEGDIKRVFFIYDNKGIPRGGHRHLESTKALICQSGSCEILVNDGKKEEIFLLDSPEICLIIKPEEWREMSNFTENAILLCISDRYYDEKDYIFEPYLIEK